MNISHICTVNEMQKFLKKNINEEIKSSAKNKNEIYQWINKILLKIQYRNLTRNEKRVVKSFLCKTTNYSERQIKRLISKHKQGKLKWVKWQKGQAARIYEQKDIELLHLVDKEHKMSGQATKKILQREAYLFGREEFRKLANISVSHLYNLRATKNYLSLGIIFKKTKPIVSNIAIRKKPEPNGRPGFLRVDTVHQGDKNGKKGIYHINFVDEVTQYEFILSTPKISEKYMKKLLQILVRFCPFIIINFHSDNGSEFINKVVANLLNKLYISQTKSRSRKTNDNALVESKNGSIVRKQYGYIHIPATEKNANILNSFAIQYLNPYLNFHRPCAFATVVINKKGKEKKIYKTGDYETPYEYFKSLPNAEQYLKKTINFEKIDKEAYKYSDTEFAYKMNRAKEKIFSKLET